MDVIESKYYEYCSNTYEAAQCFSHMVDKLPSISKLFVGCKFTHNYEEGNHRLVVNFTSSKALLYFNNLLEEAVDGEGELRGYFNVLSGDEVSGDSINTSEHYYAMKTLF
jgi:hypothetical protein